MFQLGTIMLVGWSVAVFASPSWPGADRIALGPNQDRLGTLNGRNGTVATRVARASRVVDVRQYGAKGDGVTEDTTSCQAAFLAGVGGIVVFPAGTYLVDGLEVLAGTHVLLSSGCVLKLRAGATHAYLLYSSASNVRITGYGATVDANGGSQIFSKLHGIMFVSPGDEKRTGVTIEGVTIQDASSRAIAIAGFDNVVIQDIRVEAGDNPPDPLFGLGIYVQGRPDNHCQNVTVTQCYFTGNRNNGDGIVFSYVDNGRITGNIFEQWGRTAPEIPYYSFNIDVEHEGAGITIENNLIHEPEAGGIAAKGAGVLVSHNTVRGGPKASNVCSIYISTTDDFLCTANTILSPGAAGIRLNVDAARGIIMGNTLEGPQDHDYFAAIDIYGATHGVEIARNVIVGKGTYASATYGVLTRGAHDANSPHAVFIHDNKISGFNATYAIRADDLADYSQIVGNTIENGHSGILLTRTIVPTVDQVQIRDNILRNLTNYGIVIKSPAVTNTTIHTNMFDDVTTPWIDGGTNTMIQPREGS